MYFDKTKNLQGYNSKLSKYEGPPILGLYDKTKAGYDRLVRFNNIEVIRTILKNINATITVKLSSDAGNLDEQGEPHGMVRDILTSTVDMTIKTYLLHDYWKRQAYPFSPSIIKIISLKNTLTYIDRFLNVFDAKFLVFLIIICSVFIISLKYLLQQSTAETALDFLRMFVSAATLKVPENFLKTLIFLILMFAVFIAGSHFQSSMNAIITAPDIIATVDSVKDLMESNMSIYGPAYCKELMRDKEIQERYRVTDKLEECLDRFSKKERAACVDTEKFARFLIHENETIHVSEENVMVRYATYNLAEDSPLLYKINWIIFQLMDGGFVQLYYNQYRANFSKPDDESDLEERLSIDDFIFIFCMLAVSLVAALLAFLAEVTLHAIKRIDFRKYKIKLVKIFSTNSIKSRLRRLTRK